MVTGVSKVGSSSGPWWLGDLVAQGSAAIGAFDASGGVVYANAALADLVGLAPEELIGVVSVLDLVHPADTGRVLATLDGVGVGARPLPGVIRVRSVDGAWRLVEVNVGHVDLPPPPEGPGPVVVVVARDYALQDAHWQFLAALSGGESLRVCVDHLARGLSSAADGPLAISYADGTTRRFAGPVPRVLAGLDPLGGLDVTPGTPWEEACRTGEPAWSPVDRLPEPYRSAAGQRGAEACVAVAVADPGHPDPALLVQWPPSAAMGHLLGEALARRPHQSMTLALERRDALSRLERLAHHDDLTGLVDRGRFFQVLDGWLDDGRPCGVCYIDLDGFKPVNDTHGHTVGDRVLVAAARRLETLVRPGDLVARLGGDEFTIARAGEDAHELEDLAQGVVDALRKPIEVDGLALSIGASVGYAVARQADTASAVVAAADAALYDAKRAGRGTWRASAFTHSPHPA